MGKDSEAETAFLKYLTGDPTQVAEEGGAPGSIARASKDAEGFYELGRLYYDQERYAQAVKQFKHAVENAPKDAQGKTGPELHLYLQALKAAEQAAAASQ